MITCFGTDASIREYSTCRRLSDLRSLLTDDGSDSSLRAFLLFVRFHFIRRHLTDDVQFILTKAGIPACQMPVLSEKAIELYRQTIEDAHIDWGDVAFHLHHRIHLNRASAEGDFALFFALIPTAKQNEERLREIVREGIETKRDANSKAERRFYDLSILPLNLALGENVVNYFVPPVDYLEPHSTKRADPYGIIRGHSRVDIAHGEPTAIIDRESKLLLGAHKFNHTFLLNIDFYCPIGCSDCYKTRMGTREYVAGGAKLAIYDHPELGQLNPPSRHQVIEQVRRTVHWMNEEPRGQQVYDVIVSGGEPLWMSNDTIEAILNELRCANNLRILRICTGVLFLGVPFRIDDQLLGTLARFSQESGVRVTIQAHLGNHHMISPEAVIAIQNIRRHGIPIYSQVPIKNGVNFFLDDPGKTLEYMCELARRQVVVGVEPYMFIADMHPSTNLYYVPIEPLMQMWARLVESHDYPGLERPKTLSILFEGGNIILSGHTLFSAKKDVQKQNDRVVYHIPRITTGARWKPQIAEVFHYDEPLLKGINDDPHSLEKLRQVWREA